MRQEVSYGLIDNCRGNHQPDCPGALESCYQIGQMLACSYWILKLEARFFSGDYVEALAAANKSKQLLWVSTPQIPVLDYFYYSALTVRDPVSPRSGWDLSLALPSSRGLARFRRKGSQVRWY